MIATRHIALGAVDIQPEDIERVNRCLHAKELSPGHYQRELEQAVAKAHGKLCGTMVNSGQSALHLALEHLKREQGVTQVVVPAVTYISSLHAVWNAGLEVILCDVDPKNWLLKLPYMVEPWADTAIMPVDLFGKSWNAYNEQTWGIPIVEDACEAIGAAGVGYGDMVCFSFYASHSVTTGSGGMVCTNWDNVDRLIKRLANHGRRDATDLYLSPGSGKRFVFDDVGYSYKSSDLNAAVAIGQFERLQGVIFQRQRNAERLLRDLSYLPIDMADPHAHSFQMFPMVLREPGQRDRFMAYLTRMGIECREAMPIVTQPVVKRMLGIDEADYPVAAKVAHDGLYIGCHHQLEYTDIEYVVDVIRTYFR